MSVYEEPIKEKNMKIEGHIRRLKKDIKPVERPIVRKILPFPYEVNKIILDNLEIMKKIYIYKKRVKTLIKEFLDNRLPYYYKPFKPNSRQTKEYKSEMDYEIRKKIPLNHFHYQRWDDYNIITSSVYYSPLKKLEFEKDSQALKMVKKAFEEIAEAYESLQTLLFNMDSNLTDLEHNRLEQRINTDILITNEYGDTEFKILKSNKTLNSKQYNKFLEYVKDYVLRQLNNIEYEVLDQIRL